MSFHDVRFPTDVSYGSFGGPTFNTSVIETDSGVEERVSRRNDPRYVFNAAYGIKKPSQTTAVRDFYIARKGPANGFRYKDWSEYHSNSADGGHSSAPGVRDQLLGTGDGTTTAFQLVKVYSSGPTSYSRRITKPVLDSTRVWVNGVELTAGTQFTVDTSTGVVTCSSAPASGHAVEASFEFDVPVRFVEDDLLTRLNSYGDGSIDSIAIVEIVDTNSSNVGEYFYGGAEERTFGVNVAISTSARSWIMSTSTAGLSVSLPDPTAIPTGGPIFYITNGGAQSFTLKDHAGATLATLASGAGVEVILSVTSGGTKVWYAA